MEGGSNRTEKQGTALEEQTDKTAEGQKINETREEHT